jgi:hypothetical protein
MIRRALGANSSQFVSRIGDADRTKCGESPRATRCSFFPLDGGEGTGMDPPNPVLCLDFPAIER